MEAIIKISKKLIRKYRKLFWAEQILFSAVKLTFKELSPFQRNAVYGDWNGKLVFNFSEIEANDGTKSCITYFSDNIYFTRYLRMSNQALYLGVRISWDVYDDLNRLIGWQVAPVAIRKGGLHAKELALICFTALKSKINKRYSSAEFKFIEFPLRKPWSYKDISRFITSPFFSTENTLLYINGDNKLKPIRRKSK